MNTIQKGCVFLLALVISWVLVAWAVSHLINFFKVQ